MRLPLYLLFEGKGLKVLEHYKEDLDGFFKLKDNSNVNKDLNALAKLAKWINVYHFIQHVTQMLPY